MLVWAALSILQAWIVNGTPVGSKRLGAFEEWSNVIGGTLEVAGISGFLENFDEFRLKGDWESEAIRGLVDAWAQKFQTSEVKTQELLPFACSVDLGSGSAHSQLIRLGKLLQARTDQRFGNWVIRRESLVDGYQRWRLEEAAGRG
jgi:hypothetical protein